MSEPTIYSKNNSEELERILQEYRRRDATLPVDYYSHARLPNLFIHQSHERELLKALTRLDLLPLTNRTILDTGCGKGDWLGVFERFGALQSSLYGVELRAEYAVTARQRFPQAEIWSGDASQLPWSDQSFDIIFQRMMFSSVLDPAMRQAIAQEHMRLLKPGGAVVSIDFFYNNPRNPNVLAIGRHELSRLYSNGNITYRWITLAPPVVRRLIKFSWWLCETLEAMKVLNTYLIASIQKPKN